MAAWMLYATLSAAALGATGLLVERALTLRGRPARWPWLLVMLASVGWPFAWGVMPGGGMPGRGDAASLLPGAAGGAGEGRMLADGLSGGLPDLLLLGGWVLASALLLALLLLSARALEMDSRRWRVRLVEGERVLLSSRTGPAVVGILRPRIVLPAWVLRLEAPLRRLIVLHERDHLRAGDSRLLGAGLLLLVLLPWCLPLWWQLHRLRAAVEADCDRRLLRAGVPARDYAQLLLAVAQRRRRSMLPLAAMAPSKAALKRRIRLIGAWPPHGSGRLAPALLTAAALLPLGLAAVPPPQPPSVGAVAAQLRPASSGTASAETGPLPDGSLPGDPGEARLAAAIEAHHAGAVAAGLPEGSIVWFIADRSGAVMHTGIELGAGPEVVARIRARHPAETSDFVLAFDGVPAGGAGVDVVWLLPPR